MSFMLIIFNIFILLTILISIYYFFKSKGLKKKIICVVIPIGSLILWISVGMYCFELLGGKCGVPKFEMFPPENEN